MTAGSTQIKVVTLKSNDFASSVCDHDDEEAKLADDTRAVDSSKGVETVSRISYRRLLKYQPNSKTTYITHRGRWYSSSRHTRPNTFAEDYDRFIELRCLGRNTRPIKELLRDVQKHASTSAFKMTEIFSPSGATEHSTWLRQSLRPSRSIDTVSLDETQKLMILNDVKAYLHPDTVHWYGSRGITYRRGYLFHGPPGTVKTS